MMNSSPDDYRKHLEELSRSLQIVAQDVRKRGNVSDAQQSLLAQIERKKERLAATLSDARPDTKWDLMKTDFAAEWNSVVEDLTMLRLGLDSEVENEARAEQRS
jgi:hypothetical protein